MKSQLIDIEGQVDPHATYTTLEVARLLGMAVRSVQLMVDRGDLQAWRTPGGHRRITGESLRAWVRRSQRVQHTDIVRRGGRQRSPSPSVLLIEDSAHFQQLVSMLIRQRFPGVRLHVADDGISGLVSFGQLQPDLLILDILLPSIDGASMLLGLRRHALFGRCQLIVLTALDEVQRAEYAYALEGVMVVHKPNLMRDLPALMEKALGQFIGLSSGSAPDSEAAT